MNELEKAKNLIELGRTLRERRKELGLNLQDIEKTAHINFSNIAKLERAEVKRPKIDVLEKLSKRYSLDLDWLVVHANKIPKDVYWKIVENPKLVKIIREMEI